MDSVPDIFRKDIIRNMTDDELRAEARRRGMELHSKQFSEAAQSALRELEALRKRIDELMKNLRPQAEPPEARRFAKPGEV